MRPIPDKAEFLDLARRSGPGAGEGARRAIPLSVRLMGDQLTPVLAYRRLVVQDERTAPSFLFESVEGGSRVGRHSILGAQPTLEVIARGNRVTVRRRGAPDEVRDETDPLDVPRRLTAGLSQAAMSESMHRALPSCFLGGWVGFAGYDSVRYAEPEKLPFSSAPRDDRNLPDLHLAFYDRVVVFDHATTLVHVVVLVEVGPGDDAALLYDRAAARLVETSRALQTHSTPLSSGAFDTPAPNASARAAEDAGAPGLAGRAGSNLTRAAHAQMIERAKAYIRAGDIFQVVLGQRFERASFVDPFDVYRALRAVNPSPYMGYLQSEGCILVASSPEILCRVRRSPGGSGSAGGDAGRGLVLTSRPLAGTRRRGATSTEDAALERELLADPKERAEHIMLVDLGRNDVGKVAEAGSVKLAAVMEVERYSHVMHISSTVEGVLRPGLDAWDALRASLPVGTISGAPKVRAMQIIDELEGVRRGPYGGGFGYAGVGGEMDMALALRTIVVPTERRGDGRWTYHVQAAGGIVFDSDASAEYDETVNKAAALLRAIEVAERAFSGR